jgi:hypothetical protein
MISLVFIVSRLSQEAGAVVHPKVGNNILGVEFDGHPDFRIPRVLKQRVLIENIK